MSDSVSAGRTLASGAFWTMVGYGVAQIIRFATSVVLTRILAPQLFGIMMIVNTVRSGIELLSDIGITQSVIRSPNGEKPAFYRTAWTLQIGRGLILFIICALISFPISAFYDLPILNYLLPAAGLTLLIAGFTSMALPMLRRKMNFRRLAIFEIITALIYSVFQVSIAYLYPTVWALIAGLIFGSMVSVLGSFLLSDIRNRIAFNRIYMKEIFVFGLWITALSGIYFLTANFDRIYLPTILTLEILGVFAIARTITDVTASLFVRLNNSILFPYVASNADIPRDALRKNLSATRVWFLCGSAATVGLLATSADLLVTVLFDPRYQAAGWMASILIVGIWFSVLASTAESALLGLGRPQAGTFANGAKLVWLIVSIPAAFGAFGMIGAIVAISAGDGVRYLATVHEQKRASFSFLLQDASFTLVLLAILGIVWSTRIYLGIPFQLPNF